MVGVFSKLRAAVTDARRLRGYVVYATGEVILIVLGILIAIQLDAAQQRRHERDLERNYISNILKDVRFDIGRSEAWTGRFDRKVAGLLAAKDFHFGGPEPEDPQALLNEVGIGGAGSRGALLGVTPTFEELVSTGNLRYIRDDAVKGALLDFYGYKEFILEYASNLRSDYATYTNAGRPYGPRGKLVPDPRDVPVALARLREPEFLALINGELTFAYSIDSVMQEHIAQARALIATLDTYLATF